MNLIKSTQRVADHGEVFTPPWLVEAVLDLDGPSTARLAVFLTSAANQAIADALKAAR